jgi:uncharacterized repeat protein (TIGR02543 family)
MAVMLSLCIVLTLAFAPMSAYAGGSGAAPAESESVAVPAAVGEEEAADSGSDGEVGSGGQQDQEALGDPADEAGISELAIDEPAGPEEAEADADAEAEAAAEAVADAEPVEIIVVMKDRADEEAVVEDVSGGDDTVVDTVSLGDGEKMVVVEAVADPEEAIAAYEEDPNVAFAQPNYSYGLMDEEPVEPLGSVEALAAATDTKYGFQWALQEGAMPGVAEAWDLMPAEAGKVRVAVLDTGVQYNHPDLDDNINTSLAYDAHLGLPGVSNITDPTGHGTHVTGIIAAETNKNDTANSVAGVSANHAEIVPIRVFFNTAEGYVSSTRDLVAGLEYAMANGCKIVNISAGGPEEDLALKGKLDEAKAAGVLVICAAGNAKNEDPVYPSDFDSVISVTATNKDNKWADNFGSSKSPGSSYNAYKDIAAPGGSADNLTLGQDDSRILSTFPTSGLGYASGTSMASPFVAGVAAMVWAASPGLSRDEVENLLLSTATDITDAPATPGRDDYTGKGLVNAAAAVGQAVLMHTVTFKNYNGTVLKMEVVDDGMNATAPAEPVRTGYEFAGWDTEFTNVTENLTVTATFSAKTYTVTFNAGSGSKATPATKTVTYDQPIGTLATASARTGSTFLGWYTAASGGTQVTAATVYRVAGNTTYYAHWSGSTNKWVTDGGKWYYFGPNGTPLTGWQTVDGQVRYFDPAQGGACPQGWFVHSNGKKYYFWWGGAGIFATGLADIGGRTYYFNSQGHLVSGWQTVDGQTRYFDPAQGGAAPQGWFTHSNGKRYYFWWGGKGVFATGVAQIGSKCYYFNPQGHLTSGWQTYAGQVRYFDPAQGGAAPEGWFKHSNGETYYFWPGGGGTFATGLAAIGGGGDEYYFNAQGHLVRNASGIIYGIWVIKTDANGKATKWVSEVLRGIDVSEWQGKIDWGAVKASGVDFAIIRAGWTDWKNRTGEGMGAYFHPDSRFVQNVREARAAGLAVGTYIYVYSRNIQEQEWGLANFEAYVRSNGLIFDLPVFLDIEDDKYYLPSTNNLGGYGYRTTMLQHGLAQLRGYGYQPGFYTFLNWANTQFDAKGLYDDGNSFWLARWYNNDSELDKYTTSWNGTYPSLWQYRSTGKVSGISGNVDMNYMYPLFLKP